MTRSRRPSPETLYAEYLKEHGITPKEADKLGLHFYPSGQELDAALPGLPRIQLRGGFTIPYHDWAGKPTGFHRARFLGPLVGVAALTNAKVLRYCQPAGAQNQLYIPPNKDWRQVRADPSKWVMITEGEIKAAKAMLSGLFTLALGGVDNFRDKDGFLPALEEIAWKKRTVFITFDSDRDLNPNIKRAERSLAAELLKRGADVRVAELCELEPGRKMGLDDYLLQSDVQTFIGEILANAVPCEGAQDLYDMNDEFAVVLNPFFIVRLAKMQDMRLYDFKEGICKNRHYTLNVGNGDRPKYKKFFTAAEWVDWEGRNEVERRTYAPGKPRPYTDENELNSWPGWACEPLEGDVQPFLDLLNFLTQALTETERTWFLRWIAHQFQYPGVKISSAVIVWSKVHGTGKTMLGEMLRKVFGKNSIEIEDRHLDGNFNEWSVDKQFVMGDEIAGGPKKREIGHRMKSMITRTEILINKKNVPQYVIPDCINYYFTSNRSDSFFLEDTDRRFFVVELKGAPREQDFYMRCGEWMESPAGPPALLDYLLKVDLGDFNRNAAPPVTTAKKQMISDGRSDIEAWLQQLPDCLTGETREWTVATAVDLLQQYEAKCLETSSAGSDLKSHGFGKKLRFEGFAQWVGPARFQTDPDGEGGVVKSVGSRLWIVSRDPAVIKGINQLNEKQVGALYVEQHPKPKRKY